MVEGGEERRKVKKKKKRGGSEEPDESSSKRVLICDSQVMVYITHFGFIKGPIEYFFRLFLTIF